MTIPAGGTLHCSQSCRSHPVSYNKRCSCSRTLDLRALIDIIETAQIEDACSDALAFRHITSDRDVLQRLPSLCCE